MLVHNLCKQLCPERIPCTVGKKLGDGADGEVFDIVGRSDRVIKFCVLYETGSDSLELVYRRISKVIDYLIGHPDPVFAKVYRHNIMGQFTRTVWKNNTQRYVMYYYFMEKLEKITDDERKVFDTLLSHEDKNKKKIFTPEKFKEIISGLSSGLDFDKKKVTFFCDNLKVSPVQHLDIHPRNIMKDDQGNFKMIDFDRAQLNGVKNGKERKG